MLSLLVIVWWWPGKRFLGVLDIFGFEFLEEAKLDPQKNEARMAKSPAHTAVTHVGDR